MIKKPCAFITAGTGIRFRHTRESFPRKFLAILDAYIARALEISGNRESLKDEYTGDTLPDQVVNYSFNCALITSICDHGIIPDFLAGYSMGIYSALFAGGAIDFDTGVLLLSNAYRCFAESFDNSFCEKASMGSIIGLSLEAVKSIIAYVVSDSGKVNIANVNNPYSIVVAGLKQAVKDVLQYAAEEGAIQAKEINVSYPYHSHFLKEASHQFAICLDAYLIKDSKIPIISTISRRVLCIRDQIKKELALNLSAPISWLETMLALEERGINNFIEISGDKSLQKIGKFIKPYYQFHTYKQICATDKESEVII